MNTAIPRNKQGLGELLRYWRETRGKSQLDLSLDSGLSQRHLSFIENGRSVPSRQTLLDVAQALDVPLRERNTLFLSAGYAPAYSEDAWNAPEMQSITKALERLLRQHEPFSCCSYGPLLERAPKERCGTALLQLFYRSGEKTNPTQLVASDVRPRGYAPVHRQLGGRCRQFDPAGLSRIG